MTWKDAVGFAVGASIAWFIVIPTIEVLAREWGWPRAAAVGVAVAVGSLAIVVTVADAFAGGAP